MEFHDRTRTVKAERELLELTVRGMPRIQELQVPRGAAEVVIDVDISNQTDPDSLVVLKIEQRIRGRWTPTTITTRKGGPMPLRFGSPDPIMSKGSPLRPGATSVRVSLQSTRDFTGSRFHVKLG